MCDGLWRPSTPLKLLPIWAEILVLSDMWKLPGLIGIPVPAIPIRAA